MPDALRLRAFAAASAFLLVCACGDRDRPVGRIEGEALPAEVVRARSDALRDASRSVATRAGVEAAPKRILFGDLHVHTTYSIDAFIFSLPLFGGEGAHPPADACDFARYCSGVDFFSLNDHAEGLTPERWRRSIDSLRECNARAGDPADPDLVAYVGWEWTQVGSTPETHYGHKNVIFPGLADDELPTRPITSLSPEVLQQAPSASVIDGLGAVLPVLGMGEYADFLWLVGRLAEVPNCPDGVPVRELPDDCRENAPTARVLFDKLAQWGFETLVIPHGLAWGIHAPRGARLDNQLTRADHDPSRQRLLEVYSGHGNGEEFRDFPEAPASAEARCPEPTADFLPCCWRAGEIMRARCGDLPEAECEARVREARRLALAADRAPHVVFPDTQVEDWLDCDQCRDCFKPAMNLRPGETAQYGLAVSNFDEPRPDGRPLRFRFGFIASSDNHTARPGTGYKQFARKGMTDARGVRSRWHARWIRPFVMGKADDPRRPSAQRREERTFASLLDSERGASFMYPGGLVAVHSDARTREAIWDALGRREVYGTSGPRILLWFDLLDSPAHRERARLPMGSEVSLDENPRFQVRAVGAFVQKPGCPESSESALSSERLERLCLGECYHPGDARHPIAAIEVVRVRPQREPGEPVAPLIEDPWRRFPCEPDPAGCVVEFEDPEFLASGRDAAYYVRALQVETPAVNGANLRASFDAQGRVESVDPCYGDWRLPVDEDCLAPVRERAWSSPIYVDQAR